MRQPILRRALSADRGPVYTAEDGEERQWALDNLPLKYEWVLLLDADESVTPELMAEIRQAFEGPRRHATTWDSICSFWVASCGTAAPRLQAFRFSGAGWGGSNAAPRQDSSCATWKSTSMWS